MSVVVFDLDNTLIDRDAAVHSWLTAMMSDRQVDTCLTIDAGGHGDRRRFLRTVAEFAGCSVMEVRTRFRAELPRLVRPLPGAPALLERLQPRHRLAIASNGSGDLQRAKLAAVGFPVAWSMVAISAEIGAKKPDPAFFHHLLGALGCAPREALMVGDHPLNDIDGARQVGMRTCWLRTRHHTAPQQVDQVVDHLDEVRP